MKDFSKNRSMTLIIEKHTITKCKISVNISQESSFFLMLYLFYNANLLNLCENIKLRFSIIEFVNDINILTYDESTKRNCEILQKHEIKQSNERTDMNLSLMNKNTN